MSKYKEALEYFNDKSNFRYDGTEYNPVAYAHHWIAVEEALEIADVLKQAEKREIQPDMNERVRAYVMGYNQALGDLRSAIWAGGDTK